MSVHEWHFNAFVTKRYLVNCFVSACLVEPVLWIVIWYDQDFSYATRVIKPSEIRVRIIGLILCLIIWLILSLIIWLILWCWCWSWLRIVPITSIYVVFYKSDLEHYSPWIRHIPPEQLISNLKLHKTWRFWCKVHRRSLVQFIMRFEKLYSIIILKRVILKFNLLYHSRALANKIIKWREFCPYSIIITSTTAFRSW